MRSWLFLTALLAGCCLRAPADALHEFRGTVVDSQGKPVVGAEISWLWSEPGDGSKPQPLTDHVTTDASGRFDYQLPQSGSDPRSIRFLVYNAQRTEGAMIAFPTAGTGDPIQVRLAPLHAVRYALQASHPIADKEVTGHIYADSFFPIGSITGSRGTLQLPPGAYMLWVEVEDTISTKQPFTVGASDIDLPLIVFQPSKMAIHFGHGTPHLSPMRDMENQPFEVPSLTGHWTLLYFWADWCVPCIHESLPRLITFANQNQSRRDQFRIIAIRESGKTETSDWNSFHESTLRLEKELWHTVPPFPMIYDESAKVIADWGVDSFPTYALIDPAGNLVADADLDTLIARLKNQPTGSPQH